MKHITKPLLPPKRGYVEREDDSGNRYYYPVYSGYIEKEVVITDSQSFHIPIVKDQIFDLILIGGGGGYALNTVGGSGQESNLQVVLEPDTEVEVSVGCGGSVNGGTTSFGIYAQAIGGLAGGGDNSIGSGGYEHNGKVYGSGGSADNAIGGDGLCIIRYQVPVYV